MLPRDHPVWLSMGVKATDTTIVLVPRKDVPGDKSAIDYFNNDTANRFIEEGLGNLFRMTKDHAKYTPFGIEKFFDEDEGEDPPVKNRFFNGVGAWILHCCYTSKFTALSWLIPETIDQQGVHKLCSMTVPETQSAGSPEFFLMSPELLATLATYAQCTPWRTFMKVDPCPPHQKWYGKHLDFYLGWGRDTCKQRIEAALTEFYTRCPNAVPGRSGSIPAQSPSAAAAPRKPAPP
mmetsp:Transcript_72051/g.192552  ORF Transcript_72051/g.192552 Transcript_72051/m.192552 type:complete len:235 (+) Transcript_72051:389-1093(+)